MNVTINTPHTHARIVVQKSVDMNKMKTIHTLWKTILLQRTSPATASKQADIINALSPV